MELYITENLIESIKMKSQNEKILKDLLKGKKINPMIALSKYGCFRLASRINNLRSDGYNIVTRMISNPDGKQFAEYYIEGKTK